ncbi:bZIP family transcription factor protein [Rutstroemia sp. NJR-2017a WRK4]|nr:bZIP family transcription factor protein [Rutstroemia sp. NJR-2017a WRK4]
MDHSYNYPHRRQDDYALTILTQAAMQTHTNSHNNNTTDSSSSNSRSLNPNSSIPNSDGRSSNSDYSNDHHHQTNQNLTTRNRTTGISREPSSISNQQNETSHYRIPPSVPNLVGDYTTAQHRAMETLIFNPTHIPQSAYLSHPFQPTYPSSLGILSAEKYDDGRSSARTHETGQVRMKNPAQSSMPFGMLEKSADDETRTTSEEQEHGTKRKRKSRNEAPSVDDEEEARKKARGRPRVDTKDETAADRRRTQIRMAQRAYRHRKETTISSLEKQVQDLRGTNEQMNNLFINLYDYAMSRGLLQREPEFGEQLKSTTHQFLTLAKQSANDENSKDDDDPPEEIAQQPREDVEQAPARRGKARRGSPKAPQLKEPVATEVVNPWGGYTVSKDTGPEEEARPNFGQQHIRQRPEDLQVISRATEDNASFLFGSMDVEQYRVQIQSPALDPTIEAFSQALYPIEQLPLPDTHTYYELSFARRVHRATLEKGYRLLTSKNPNKKRFQEVFGFCLFYEDKQAITERFRRSLSRSAKETMSEWRAPFVHIGGAGTYYPNPENDDLMPKFRTGLSMGPFTPNVVPAQNNIDSGMRSNLDGFEGQWFDPNDLEGYLRGHGFDLPPAADYISAEIDLAALTGASSSPTMNTDAGLPPTPRSPIGRVLSESNQDVFNFDYMNDNSNKGPSDRPNSNIQMFMSFPSWETSSKDQNSFDSAQSMLGGDNSGGASPARSAENSRYSEKRIVTISVDVLIEELTSRSVCLGRAPGFRPADVNAAIVSAARKAGF